MGEERGGPGEGSGVESFRSVTATDGRHAHSRVPRSPDQAAVEAAWQSGESTSNPHALLEVVSSPPIPDLNPRPHTHTPTACVRTRAQSSSSGHKLAFVRFISNQP